MSDSSNRSGGIDISGGSAAAGRDFIGGNVINNIVVVSRFLEFAKVEGFLPDSISSQDFSSIEDAVNSIFTRQGNEQLAHAFEYTAYLLQGLKKETYKKSSYKLLPLRIMLKVAPNYVYRELWKTGHWENYALSLKHGNESVLGLHMLGINGVWQRYYQSQRDLFIVYREYEQSRKYDTSTRKMIRNADWYEYVFNTDANSKYLRPVEIETLDAESTRIFFLGFVIDLMRVGSTTAYDTHFWRSLIDYFTSNAQQK